MMVILLLPPMMLKVQIMVMMLPEKVQSMKPRLDNMAPAIVTNLQPNLLVRTLARGPAIHKDIS